MARGLVYKGSLNGTAPIYRPFQVNDGQTIKQGDIVVLSGGKASVAADGAAVGTVLGVSNTSISTTTATPNDVILVDINPASIYEATYIGTATPTVGTKYDLGANAHEFDADDTTGGFIQVVGNIDTVNKKADVLVCNRVFTGV